MAPDLDSRELARLAAALHAAPTPVRTAEEVVSFAVQQLGADHGGIVLLRRGRKLESMAATDQLVLCADSLHAELGEGPCQDIGHNGNVLTAPNLRSDPRWPRWGPKIADLGLISMLTVPFTTSKGHPIGSINLYWNHSRTFKTDDLPFAGILARHAAPAMSASLEIAGLNVALNGRKLIGQAQGILMNRYGLTDPEAFEVLRRYSQDHNRKLREVAKRLVTTHDLPCDPDGPQPRQQPPSGRPRKRTAHYPRASQGGAAD